jgi:phosphatidylglycerophosphate synthase
MKNLTAIPAFISSLRIATLPLFLYLYNATNITACLIVMAFCATTDFFDGYAARRLNATSRFGAYYDATTDFILIMGIFSIFYAEILPHLAVAPHLGNVHPVLGNQLLG